MLLIGLSGKRGSGKDTAVDYLKERYGFQRMAFADNVRRACQAVFFMTDEQLNGRLKETPDLYWDMTPRYAMQHLATEGMRHVFGDNVWIKSMFRDDTWSMIDTAISDVRFLSEIEAVKARGGKIVRLLRNPYPHERTLFQRLTGRNRLHQSERELDRYEDWDFTIDNRGSIADLHRGLDRVMEQMQVMPVRRSSVQ